MALDEETNMLVDDDDDDDDASPVKEQDNNENTTHHTAPMESSRVAVEQEQGEDSAAAASGSNNNNNKNDALATSTSTSSSQRRLAGAAAPPKSLNSVYGNRRGFLSSLSLVLNAGLMVFAHVGLSAVILSNQERIPEQAAAPVSSGGGGGGGNASPPPAVTTTNNTTTTTTTNFTNETTDFVATGRCSLADYQLWRAGGGDRNKTQQSNWCARQFTNNGANPSGCLLDAACSAQCFVQVWNYTADCAECFADIPLCSLQSGCAFICQADGESAECNACTEPCNAVFDTCSGLPRPDVTFEDDGGGGGGDDNGDYSANNTATATTATTAPTSENDMGSLTQEQESTEEICERQQEGVDAEDVNEFYTAYELQFFSAIKTAWTSDARLLAVIVILFSGIWPYTKNVLLAVAWYWPLSVQRRDSLLTWLRRLGKYTLVDVYIIIILMIGVQLEINVADGVPLVLKAEPKLAIIAFLVATAWEFVQIEWMVNLHEELFVEQDRHDKIVRMMPNWYQNGVQTNSRVICLGMWILWVVTTGLFLSGSILDMVSFTSILGGETAGCIRPYNVYTIGTVMVSDFFLLANDSVPGVWTMAISYLFFLAVFPIYCHFVHLLSFLFNFRQKHMCLIADQCWTFASVDVLVLAVFTVEYKFADLIGALAGNEGAEFFSIETELGPGFFILIAYSVCGGLLHYFFNMRLLLDGIRAEL